jgi:uncharacterized membrane protein YdjX (TVP38/TMEM64 family)
MYTNLLVCSIAPFPPHWVVNVICPHVGIGIPRFWISTFFGIMGVSVIHTTIGGESFVRPFVPHIFSLLWFVAGRWIPRLLERLIT